MNITIFIGSLSTGGAERVVCNLSNYLVNKNHKVTILTMSDKSPSYYLDKRVVHTPLYNESDHAPFLLKNLKRLFRFKYFLKKDDSNIFLSMLPWTTLITLLNRGKIKKPIVISERNDPSYLFDNKIIFKYALKYLYPKVDGFVFQTSGAKQYFTKKLNIEGEIIPNAINEDFLSDNYEDINSHETYLMAAGRLTEQKNFDLLIDSFSLISKDFPNLKLFIYGEGKLKKDLQKKIHDKKLQERVYLKGYVKDIKSHLYSSTLYILSSNFEGLPNSLMEAMAMGLPVLSTDCPPGGPASLIKHKENGYLVPVNNVDEMAYGMKEILLNDELREKMSSNAKKIREIYNPDKIYKMWENYLLKLIKENKVKEDNYGSRQN